MESSVEQEHGFVLTADAIYSNGNILTGVGLRSAQPERVTALAVAKGEIVGAGGDAEIRARFQGAATEMVDLKGAFAMPGFNDAHAHLGMGGRILQSVDLLGVRSIAEMQARVQAAAERAAAGAWVTGGGWDETLWADGRLPNRRDVDAAAMGHPAMLMRVDGHVAVASSAALAAAGITAETANPEGGEIERQGSGEPTGILRETALELVKAPAATREQRRRGLEMALADAVRHGVTTVQDFSEWEDFLVFEELEREGRLPLRIAEWLPMTEPLEALREKRARRGAADRMLRTTMLKGFLDGSLGSRTAAMKGPYADDGGNAGLPRFEQAELNAMAEERARAEFQLGLHAIGDRAAEMALAAFAAAEQAAPGRDARPRMEHCQVLSAGDFARFRELGVIASVQPNHLLTDMAWAGERLGGERAKHAYAWRSLLEAGATLAYGTDYPVEPFTPFRGVYASVTRRNEAGTAEFYPEQRLTMAETLYAYTQGAAYAEFAEAWKGKLTAGYVADFVVLDRDLMGIPQGEILQTKVLRTVVGGRTVYEATLPSKARG